MNIVHVLHEFPLPPNSGVRCDMARRLAAFRALGHHVFAVAWLPAGEPPSPAARAKFAAATDDRALLPIGADLPARLRRLLAMRRYPSYIAARIPPPAVRDRLVEQVRAFRPDLVWLEGVHPAWLARHLADDLGIPLAYRAHNIEHRYVAEQARLSPRLRQRLALTAGTWGLEREERALHRDAAHVFDISTDDLAWWRGEGYANNSWLAPQADPAILATAAAPDAGRDIDLLFVGSLSSPNNIAGLDWYLAEVHPQVAAALGPCRLVVAGRRPPADLAHRLAAAGAELIADPADVAPLFARARVMLNPILHGSGVNIKTIDMLATGRPVVTTAKGARGLPADVTAELIVADDPAAFAAAAIAAVRATRDGGGAQDRAGLLDRVFGTGAVAAALDRVAG